MASVSLMKMVLAIMLVGVLGVMCAPSSIRPEVQMAITDERLSLDNDDDRFDAIKRELELFCHDEWANYNALLMLYNFQVGRRKSIETRLEYPERTPTLRQMRHSLYDAHRSANGLAGKVEKEFNALVCEEYGTHKKVYLIRDFTRVLNDRETTLKEGQSWMTSLLKECRDDPNWWDFSCTDGSYQGTRGPGDYRTPIR